jgi:L-asparaginase
VARLLFLLTGGTLLMQPSPPGRKGAISLDEEKMNRNLLAEVPTLGRIAELEVRLLFQMDSANMQPTDWLTLAREVHGAIADYDGVVVVHGTDTMAYTASALAMILGPLPKPVVLTGSQRPLVDVRTDARQNLEGAALIATLPVPEVVIASGSRGLRGARATKRDAWGFEAFDSPNLAPLVELGIGVDVGLHVRPPAPLMAFDDRIEKRVLAVRIFPGLDPAIVQGAVRAGVRGLVLEGYGTGNVPIGLIPALVEAADANVPVVVVSQCVRGYVDLPRYEGGAAAEDAGAISAGDMTVETALAKLMVGLGRFGSGNTLREYLEASVVGERDA